MGADTLHGHRGLQQDPGIIGLGNIGTIVAERAQGLRMRGHRVRSLRDRRGGGQDEGRAGSARRSVRALRLHQRPHPAHTGDARSREPCRHREDAQRGTAGDCARGASSTRPTWRRQSPAARRRRRARRLRDRAAAGRSPLLKLPQVIGTPHLGAATSEAQINVAIAIAEQISNYLLRGEVQAAVNMPSVSAEVLQLLRPHLQLGEKLGSFLGSSPPNPRPSSRSSTSARWPSSTTGRSPTPSSAGCSRFLEANVNYVNAPAIARERGIQVLEARANRSSDFVNSITVRLKRPSGETKSRARCSAPTSYGWSGSTTSTWKRCRRGTSSC